MPFDTSNNVVVAPNSIFKQGKFSLTSGVNVPSTDYELPAVFSTDYTPKYARFFATKMAHIYQFGRRHQL